MQTPVDHNILKKLKISNKATSHHLSPYPFSKRAFKKNLISTLQDSSTENTTYIPIVASLKEPITSRNLFSFFLVGNLIVGRGGIWILDVSFGNTRRCWPVELESLFWDTSHPMRAYFGTVKGNKTSFCHGIAGIFNLTSCQVIVQLNLSEFEHSHRLILITNLNQVESTLNS